MQQTRLGKQLGIQFPLIQAPMAGGATTPSLVAAVCNAGGLGSLGAGYLTADELRENILKIRALTDKPFVVNLFIPEITTASEQQIQQACKVITKACIELKHEVKPVNPPYAPSFEEQMKVILDERIPIFSFTFGVLAPHWVNKLKNNTLLIGTATTVEEALLLEKSGIDILVVQGKEAGGHRGTFLGKAEDALLELTELLSLLKVQVKIPVIAAGGIMNSEHIAKTLTLGAAGIQMGTAFLTCLESGIHPKYKEALLTCQKDNTVLTMAFSGKFARGIRNKFTERLANQQSAILAYPIQNALTRSMRVEAAKQNCPDFMALWAGQAAYLCQEKSAADLVRELTNEIIEFNE
ncbi:NAD(P)H-dependent flavin oxidoreductase [Legionella tunisiensis]|uniref:NAD(P)H-dependent flavin oxidoreductase n=1 Tax=Legionella tunisiensis TaxID=1034944 RepID=UPI0003080973|nr:nitronate monooxygenase [Legionella tunisiensis]